MFDIGITSNIKEYYSGYIDFIDHYWLNYFEKKNINYYLIPNKKKASIKILNKINLLIIPGGNDVSDFLKTSRMRNSIENKLIKACSKKKYQYLEFVEELNYLIKTMVEKLKK